jgi:hypothetical protein
LQSWIAENVNDRQDAGRNSMGKHTDKQGKRRRSVKRQRGLQVPGLLAILTVMLLAVSAIAADKSAHPQLSEQEMLIDCAECHKTVTPQVEKEWFDSLHGLAMVKCYQCHGTFESFTVTPSKETCATCHGDMMKKCSREKSCWQCHAPHTFKVKK